MCCWGIRSQMSLWTVLSMPFGSTIMRLKPKLYYFRRKIDIGLELNKKERLLREKDEGWTNFGIGD